MKSILYISHALKDKEEAQKARSAFASKDVFVACSGDFDVSARAPGAAAAAAQPDPNARFPDQASALDDTELFIVLRPLTEDSTLNLPCIELGRYLEISKRLGRVPQVVFFHHPNVCVPDDLKEQCAKADFVAISGMDGEVGKLIDLVYGQDGGALLSAAYRKTMVTMLLDAVGNGRPRQRCVTAVSMTITIAEEDLPHLSKFKIPDSAMVGGNNWGRVFNIDRASSGLHWSVVKAALRDPEATGAILAQELERVRLTKAQHNVIPLVLKGDAGPQPWSVVVQQYEEFPTAPPDPKAGDRPAAVAAGAGGTDPLIYRFTLFGFTSPLLFDPDDFSLVATTYHLTIIAQLFRFTVVDRDLKDLQNLEALVVARDAVPTFDSDVAQCTARVRRHMTLIEAECQRRNFLGRAADFTKAVWKAHGVKEGDDAKLDEDQRALTEIMFRGKWIVEQERLYAHLERLDRGLEEAVRCLLKLTEMNARVLSISGACYAKLIERHYGDVPAQRAAESASRPSVGAGRAT